LLIYNLLIYNVLIYNVLIYNLLIYNLLISFLREQPSILVHICIAYGNVV